MNDPKTNWNIGPEPYPPCKGKNCGCTDGWNHSKECMAELEAACNPEQISDETYRLRVWKEEAMIVLQQWDKVWQALGKPGKIGDSMAEASRIEAERLKKILDSNTYTLKLPVQ